MIHASKIILIAAALTLAACSDAARFGNDTGAAGGAGASAAAGDPASPAYFEQAVGDRVLFEVDQSSLTRSARATLDDQAEWLMTNSDYNAVIEGHADERGTRQYNLALGARRANSALEYLVSKGVAENRLKVVSYGKERPIELCSDESCYSKNRRAVTVISAGATS